MTINQANNPATSLFRLATAFTFVKSLLQQQQIVKGASSPAFENTLNATADYAEGDELSVPLAVSFEKA